MKLLNNVRLFLAAGRCYESIKHVALDHGDDGQLEVLDMLEGILDLGCLDPFTLMIQYHELAKRMGWGDDQATELPF